MKFANHYRRPLIQDVYVLTTSNQWSVRNHTKHGQCAISSVQLALKSSARTNAYHFLESIGLRRAGR